MGELRIHAVDVKTGRAAPLTPTPPIFSSGDCLLPGILAEYHRLQPAEGQELQQEQILLVICFGSPVRWERRENGHLHQGRSIPGDIHVLFPGASRQLRWLDTLEVLAVSVDPNLLFHASGKAPDVGRSGSCCLGLRDPLAERLALELRTELEMGCPDGAMYVEALVTVLALRLLKGRSAITLTDANPSHGLPGSKLRQVTDYIDANLDRNISLAEIAAVADVSPYYFAHLFKRSTGSAPHQYVLERRIEWAKRLMAETEWTIADICHCVGFQSQSHFTMQFRRHTRVTPNKYRDALRG